MMDIIFDVREKVGYVTLNRPSTLNSLTLPMIEAFVTQLAEWETDPNIETIWIRGNDRAFCAGGDVKAIYQAVKEKDRELVDRFYRTEYQMNYRLATYSKPTIAFMDGIVMGGGAGIGMNCSIRVVTDDTIFAMPECAIGFFPDVGAGSFLNKCPGEIGLFLGLTGVRMRAPGLIYTGLATHYVPSIRKDHVTAEKLVGLSVVPDAGPLKDLQERIDASFGLKNLAEIEAILNARTDPWSKETLALLRLHSPLSRAITLEHLRRARGRPLKEVLETEFYLSQHMAWEPDFSEGVRAKLVDKDNKPQWQPQRLEEVDAVQLSSFFQRPSRTAPWQP